MKLRKSIFSLVALSVLTTSLAFAQTRPDRFPGGGGGERGPGGGGERGGPGGPGGGGRGPGGGDNRGPGPVRPDRPDDRRGDNRGPGNDRGPGPGPGRGDDRGHGGGGGWNNGPGRGDDRGHGGGGWGRPNPPPYRPPYNPPPRYNPPYNPPPVYNPPVSNYQSSLILNSITRQGGGEWRRINLNYPVRLQYFEVRVLSYGVQVHEAAVVTTSGNRYNIRAFSETGSFSSGRASEVLNMYEPVVAIDIRAESMGGYADLQVNVVSDGQTSLSETRY
jgi:hypothetical protein